MWSQIMRFCLNEWIARRDKSSTGKFFFELETEDSEGSRTFLWGDDYIYK